MNGVSGVLAEILRGLGFRAGPRRSGSKRRVTDE